MNRFSTELYFSNLSIDCVVFGFKDKELKVLLSKPKYAKNYWSLLGGYIFKKESTDRAANRILKERTNLENIYLQQFKVFSDENRIVQSDYREIMRQGLSEFDNKRFDAEVIDWLTDRFICIGYYALVDINKVNPQNGEFDEALEWTNIKNVPKLAFDHNEILAAGLESLRLSFDQKLIAFNLLPETFTMKELLELYETVYNREFSMNNFQKKMLELNILERLEKKYTGAQNKAPYLYRFKTEKLTIS